jgi:glycosyltransferase involved in cell wall biosynthesis
MRKVILSVTNDLTTDQRVDRVCRTLKKMGWDVLLVGRVLPDSLPMLERPYKTRRLRLLFRKGVLFYAEYNIRLFLFLLFHQSDLLISNDLDTLPANFFASVILCRNLVHDCHEYFRGVPELNGRPVTTGIWKWIEDRIFPRLKTVYAVNRSIAEIYEKEYGIEVHVIRNMPIRKENIKPKLKSELGIPEGTKILLYQGAVNVDRGLEEAIEAMKLVKTPSVLLILGTGDVFSNLKKQIEVDALSGKVLLLGPIPLEHLHSYTLLADIGLSIEKDVSLNYHFCLPNKFLDYIQAKVPVLISPLPEMKTIVEKYGIGDWIESHEPIHLAAKFDSLLKDDEKSGLYKQNLESAAKELCWENEEKVFMQLLKPYA